MRRRPWRPDPEQSSLQMQRTCWIGIGRDLAKCGGSADLPVAVDAVAADVRSVLAVAIASLYYYALTNQRVSQSLPLRESCGIGTRASY